MFYGVINETCNNIDYLEVELENSLLFFKSLDVIQESGIQIVQEGAWETFKTKIKELWDKFKKWVEGIWEKIKSIFTKKKSTIEKIKEENKKIKSSKGKVNESFNYIKEESEDSESRELKWYRISPNHGDFTDYIFSLYRFAGKCLDSAILKDDDKFDKLIVDIKAIEDKLYDYDYDGTNLFFEEKTHKFDNEVTADGVRRFGGSGVVALGDEVVRDSEDLNACIDASEYLQKKLEEEISNTEKEIYNIIKNNSDSEGNFVTIDGEEIPLSIINQACTLSVNSLKTAISFLTKGIIKTNEKMGYNLKVMIQLSHSSRDKVIPKYIEI